MTGTVQGVHDRLVNQEGYFRLTMKIRVDWDSIMLYNVRHNAMNIKETTGYKIKKAQLAGTGRVPADMQTRLLDFMYGLAVEGGPKELNLPGSRLALLVASTVTVCKTVLSLRRNERVSSGEACRYMLQSMPGYSSGREEPGAVKEMVQLFGTLDDADAEPFAMYRLFSEARRGVLLFGVEAAVVLQKFPEREKRSIAEIAGFFFDGYAKAMSELSAEIRRLLAGDGLAVRLEELLESLVRDSKTFALSVYDKDVWMAMGEKISAGYKSALEMFKEVGTRISGLDFAKPPQVAAVAVPPEQIKDMLSLLKKNTEKFRIVSHPRTGKFTAAQRKQIDEVKRIYREKHAESNASYLQIAKAVLARMPLKGGFTDAKKLADRANHEVLYC